MRVPVCIRTSLARHHSARTFGNKTTCMIVFKWSLEGEKITSPEKLALIKKHAAAPPLEELIATYFADVDIVLTEGFKMSSLPKIEVHRQERSPTLLCRGEHHDPMLVAVASDEALKLDVPVLDLNDLKGVTDFVERTFLL